MPISTRWASSVFRRRSAEPAEPPDAGSACPVVWQGRVGDHAPYADLRATHCKLLRCQVTQ